MVHHAVCQTRRGEPRPADFNHLTSRDFEPLVRALSAAYPSVRFTVRGTGEEMPDLWLRQCEAGQVVYSAGPFDAA